MAAAPTQTTEGQATAQAEAKPRFLRKAGAGKLASGKIRNGILLRGKGVDGERKCLATGEMLPKDRMIRFVIGPDHAVVPDLAHNLPGRGLWVTADAEAIKLAASKNLFAKAAKASARPDKDLAGLVGRLLHTRCLSFLGMAKSAGIAILGQLQVEQAMKADNLDMLLLADDASETYEGFIAWRRAPSEENPHKKLRFAFSNRFTRAELGAALGHDQIVYAGLKAHKLTEKLSIELARLEKIAPIGHM